ncbi:hypothetical protein JMA_29370 [Jeotgalibacillus malaysiensis]|uniref:Serine acetyltransferase n=1 Tax=Jeotgalibacillus malaysiensis TaxID=1508404 RepID=A0A0B5AW51_9BACL|nr:hypothetical protein [Jeotgalibacillus malaysiensis]AJD92254.1 hypothetical protein JMA_29370 [Jeotgalibacillus malaysiensis]
MNLLRLYKLSNFLYKKNLFKLSKLVDIINKIVNKSIVYGSTQIGEDTRFAYGGISVVIHKHAKIGQKCMIGQCVTIGGVHGKQNGVPVIENNVYIGAGAKIIGNVVIGNNTIIAPNAVVTKSIEPCSVVGGIPAKYISKINRESFNEKYKYYGIERYIDE